jgi:hypothetical protein
VGGFRSFADTRCGPDTIGRAAALSTEGRLVGFPTETVYGLGGNATHLALILGLMAGSGHRCRPLPPDNSSLPMLRLRRYPLFRPGKHRAFICLDSKKNSPPSGAMKMFKCTVSVAGFMGIVIVPVQSELRV